MNDRNHDEHGNRCSCRLLADLIGCHPKMVRFTYCQAVLMKHWTMECNHGCHDEIVESGSIGKWHDVGPVDPVTAILIKNG
jgi:hypothetical protein